MPENFNVNVGVESESNYCCFKLFSTALILTILTLLLHIYNDMFCPQPEDYSGVQMKDMEKSLLYKGPLDPANWVGLEKSDDLLGYLRVRSTNSKHYKNK